MSDVGSLVNFDLGGLRRAAARLDKFSTKKIAQLKKRAIVSMSRALKAEAAREVSDKQLNLRPGQIAPYIQVKIADDYVSVYASKKRLPLSAYKAKFSKKNGATVTTWKDAAPLVLPHGFKRGREVWQRVPYHGQPGQYATKLGLVPRLPIVLRKGPSLAHTLRRGGSKNDHRREEVVAHLTQFGRKKLSDEIARLLSY